MARRMRSAATAFAIGAVVWGLPLRAQPPRELYRRVVPLEASTGVAAIGQRVELELDVPDHCPNSSETPRCASMRRFARLYRIEFLLEARRMTPAGSELDPCTRATRTSARRRPWTRSKPAPT